MMPVTYQGMTMKPNRYRRKRAEEIAHRDYLAGVDANPFPEGTGEHSAYRNRMRYFRLMDDTEEEMFAVYGTPTGLVKRSPDSVSIRPPLPAA